MKLSITVKEGTSALTSFRLMESVQIKKLSFCARERGVERQTKKMTDSF